MTPDIIVVAGRWRAAWRVVHTEPSHLTIHAWFIDPLPLRAGLVTWPSRRRRHRR